MAEEAARGPLSPYRRLSYYDRDYKTLELTLTWPKRPFVVYNVFPPNFDEYVREFAQERLRELFGVPTLQMRKGIFAPVEATVQWEGHAVKARVSCPLVSVETWGAIEQRVNTNECFLYWGVEGNAAWAEKVCADHYDWVKTKRCVHKDFVGTANTLVTSQVALVRSYDALSVAQIMHLVRGELPEAFPSLEEFESILPPHVIDQSKANFEQFLKASERGKLGIENAPVAEPVMSWAVGNFFRSLFRPLYVD